MRTLDASLLNEIANDPMVRPWLLGADGPLDLTGVVSNVANVTIVNEFGGFIAVQISTELYEVHTIFTPQREGMAEVLTLASDAVSYMFTHTGCTEMITRVADDNRSAHIVAGKAGFKDFATLPNMVPGKGGRLMRQTIDEWTLRAAGPRVEGFSFHSILEEAKQRTGSALPAHDDDERHDRFVGAAIMMAKAGQVVKGWATYNRAAFIYGYRPITLLSQGPAVADFGEAIIGLENGQVEVMLCR